jgi:hypothetical protein
LNTQQGGYVRITSLIIIIIIIIIIAKLERIQNSAARLVSHSTKRKYITPVLKELQWLPISSRIQYKLLITTFKAIHGTCPSYLSDLIIPYVPARPLRSSSQHLLTIPPVRTKSLGSRTFSSAAPNFGTLFPATSALHRAWNNSKLCSNPNCFLLPIGQFNPFVCPLNISVILLICCSLPFVFL